MICALDLLHLEKERRQLCVNWEMEALQPMRTRQPAPFCTWGVRLPRSYLFVAILAGTDRRYFERCVFWRASGHPKSRCAPALSGLGGSALFDVPHRRLASRASEFLGTFNLAYMGAPSLTFEASQLPFLYFG
jgi:hypothetical protein